MNFIIREEDRRAIDLLLDHAVAVPGKAGTPGYAAADGLFQQRVGRIEKVLGLLDYIPVAEPPKHLLNHTLRHVKEASGRDVTIPRHVAPAAFSSTPPVA